MFSLIDQYHNQECDKNHSQVNHNVTLEKTLKFTERDKQAKNLNKMMKRFSIIKTSFLNIFQIDFFAIPFDKKAWFIPMRYGNITIIDVNLLTYLHSYFHDVIDICKRNIFKVTLNCFWCNILNIFVCFWSNPFETIYGHTITFFFKYWFDNKMTSFKLKNDRKEREQTVNTLLLLS